MERSPHCNCNVLSEAVIGEVAPKASSQEIEREEIKDFSFF